MGCLSLLLGVGVAENPLEERVSHAEAFLGMYWYPGIGCGGSRPLGAL